MDFVFVGERPSKTALVRGWRWQDGRLAAKQLFEALQTNGIDPSLQTYLNLFRESLDREHKLAHKIIPRLKKLSTSATIVAMGQKVTKRLTMAGIDHVTIVHPAARGRIRNKSRYAEHVRKQLLPSGEQVA